MVFSSTLFLILFLPIVIILYFNPLVKERIFLQNAILLFASILFYAYGEPVYVLLLIISGLVTWLSGKAIAGGGIRSVLL